MSQTYLFANTNAAMNSFWILSIRSVHSERIFNRKKLYELRRRLPKTPVGRVFIYETGGHGVVGCFDVGRIINLPVNELWRNVGEDATAKERFFSYFENVERGNAIEIKSPVRFRRPITVQEIRNKGIAFSAPMSFKIVECGTPLYVFLEHRRKQEIDIPKVELREIDKTEKATYKKIVTEVIGKKYDDITPAFAESNIQSHESKDDPNGIFTKFKEVLSVFNENNIHIGFTTLTTKINNTVKTGPTIIFPQFHGVGYGKAIRRAIEDRVRVLNVRKIYCTCPDNDSKVISYLLTSGFNIEGHLKAHYHRMHGELVLGKIIGNVQAESAKRPKRHKSGEIVECSRIKAREINEDVAKVFEKTFFPIGSDLALKMIENAKRKDVASFEQKPLKILLIMRNEKCRGVVLMLRKRGGALKVLLVAPDLSRRYLKSVLDSVSKAAEKSRKIYFLHPMTDIQVIKLLANYGFTPEGVLRHAYAEGQHLIVMSKFNN